MGKPSCLKHLPRARFGNSEKVFAATSVCTVIRVRFAIRVGGLYTQNIVHVRVDFLPPFCSHKFEQVPHELLVAFKYAVDVLMQTTRGTGAAQPGRARGRAARTVPVRWRTL